MKAVCCCCGCVMDLAIDEFLKIEEGIDEFICDECSGQLYDLMIEWKLRLN